MGSKVVKSTFYERSRDGRRISDKQSKSPRSRIEKNGEGAAIQLALKEDRREVDERQKDER
jgi:hypothetical protein